MREYNEKILSEIQKELTFIWTAHKVLGLQGKMRLFTTNDNDAFWDNRDKNLELWFGPSEISSVIKKIELFYREGKRPNSTYLLDPMVYSFSKEGLPIAEGTGLFWTTIFCPDTDPDKKFTSKSLSRIRDLGLFASPITSGDDKKAGIKIIGFLKKPLLPKKKQFSSGGTLIEGMQDIVNIADAKGCVAAKKHLYILSGLEYYGSENTYQHRKFDKIFKGAEIENVNDIINIAIEGKLITDAGTCWQAYNRDHNLYLRYGVDPSSIKSNLQNKEESDRAVKKIKNELAFFWKTNSRFNLKGYMRLYSSPNQDSWRSKQEGVSIWFTEDEESLNRAAEKLQLFYNGGMLPNSPLLLDPVVYSQLSDKSYVPIGTGIIWSSAINIGLETFSQEGEDRIKDLGLLTGKILRAGDEVSGIKIIGFLDKPYLFSKQEILDFIEAGKPVEIIDEEEEFLKKLNESKEEKEEEEEGEEGKEKENDDDENSEETEEEEDDDEEDDEDEEDKDDTTFCRDFLGTPASLALSRIYGSNAENLSEFFMITSMEYLCTNGSFANMIMEEEIGDTDKSHQSLIKKYTVAFNHIMEADYCWKHYDGIHLLWQRFAVDKANINENLKYYTLCGKSFEILAMLNKEGGVESEEDESDASTSFLVDGLLANGTITFLVGNNATGKSTLVHKLAVMCASDYGEDEEKPKWLGSNVNTKYCKGLTIYFSGKDSEAVVKSREGIFTDKFPSRVITKYDNDFGDDDDGNPLGISDFLKTLYKLPDVSLVIVDSARKYVQGDETDKEAVTIFFDALQKFSAEKGCPILVVHHAERDNSPNTATDMLGYIRGTDLFAERPNVIIGLLKDGAKYYSGIAKNGLPPSMDTQVGEKVFTRDTDTLDLIQLPGDEGIRIDK